MVGVGGPDESKKAKKVYGDMVCSTRSPTRLSERISKAALLRKPLDNNSHSDRVISFVGMS